MAGALPNQIPAQSAPCTYTDANGKEHFEEDWYLFLYGLWIQVYAFGGGVVLPPSVAVAMLDADVEAVDAQQASARAASLQALLPDLPDPGPTLRDQANTLLLALDGLLPDPAPCAQPAQAVAASASPFTFTALAPGTLAISGGTVSAVAIVRQGTSVPTGATAGLVPMSRLDQVQITFTVAPTVNFLPT